MNRLEWRKRAAQEVNWDLDDVDSSFVDKVALDQAGILDLVHQKAPGALMPDTETVLLYKDYTGTTMGCKVSVAPADNRVLVFSTATTNPKVDGTWDGLFHIEVKDPDGKWHRRTCREFWESGGVYSVTIDRPWRNLTDATMEFRLFQPYVVLKSDVFQVLDAQVYDASRTLVGALPEGWAHMIDQNDFQGRSKGRPELMYRSKEFQLDAPNYTPPVALAAGTLVPPPWVYPEPTGTFDYCYTFVLGRRGEEIVAPGGTQDPTFESSPSPTSSKITVPSDGSRCIDITLPNIDHQLGFNLAGKASSTHSGYRIRIYRRRHTVTGSGGKTPIEAAGVFMFLAEVDGSATTYRDDGSVIPDYHRRLPESHGYYLWRVVPYPIDDFQFDVRVRRKPGKLVNDYDAPRVDPAFNDMLVCALASKLLAKRNRPAEAADAWKKFMDGLVEYSGLASPFSVVPGTMRDAHGVSPAWDRKITLAPFKA